ncbi:hypothetical protein [Nocardioides sp.]|uniref:hypothetical protein n=1 Tax=Nocardioides sp. TaxID=35761 RepID=UPI00261A3004|nr:hypothetical protein [Nocardioides sp.]MCW2735457.1 hypothetical protein [Nocardioides sp.]
MNANEYKQLMALGDAGTQLETKDFDELTAYATRRKVRRPKPEWLLGAPVLVAVDGVKVAETRRVQAGKATTPTRYENQGAACSDADCDRAATSRGMCSMHYTRAYRSSDERREKAREASRRYAAKKRAERESAAAE